jgi:hypothetical protein
MNERQKAGYQRQLALKLAIPRRRKIRPGLQALRRLHRLLRAQSSIQNAHAETIQ